ncbi:MAG: TonB-dependent siderophore receptor [Flavobacteriaceae bacterium]
MKPLFSAIILLFCFAAYSQSTLEGVVKGKDNQPIPYATVYLKNLQKGTNSNNEGIFSINNIPQGEHTITASAVGYKTASQKINVNNALVELTFTLDLDNELSEVELFGIPKKQPKGLEIITRMPLEPRDQIQSISVISSKVIEELGGLTVTDVAKNVPGVTQFANYAGTRESMSIRGYRGVPVLKNGVMMDGDFRTAAILTDMQGVESIQVIKGSAAITQGIGNGLGSAGGVINLVTKTPQFVNAGNVAFRYGSWNFYRPTLDVQRVLDKSGKLAARLNVAYQDNEAYTKYVNTDRIYINPSLAYRPDDKTNIVLQMDYMKDNTTPNNGTINLAADDTYAIYTMPKDKFLGFSSDNNEVNTLSFSVIADRKITEKLKLRAAYFNSGYKSDLQHTFLGRGSADTGYSVRDRGVEMYGRDDKNQVFQFDFIGEDVKTGSINHTFQVGFDFNQTNITSYSFRNESGGYALYSDTIDVLQDFTNELPEGTTFYLDDRRDVTTLTPTYGFMAQDVITLNKYIKLSTGLRYSKLNGVTQGEDNSAWNPSVGVLVSPVENINVFASYTTTTSLRSANNPMENGDTVGPSKTTQWESGVKSDWFDERLRFNLTLFYINNDNLSYSVLNDSGSATGYYDLAGNLKRTGIEAEIIGRINNNLQVMAGYAYLDAQYQDSPAYVNGSRPMNAPKHTANAWLNYKLNEGALNGLDFGAGIYSVGDRPVNEYTQRTFAHNTGAGVKPFNLKAYTTVEAQVGYQINQIGIRFFLNNIFNEEGYTAYYRGGYINRINPRNFGVQLNYKF